MFSCVWLFVTPWTVALQAPLSMGFLRQENWSGVPFSSPKDIPIEELNPHLYSLLHWQADGFLTSSTTWVINHQLFPQSVKSALGLLQNLGMNTLAFHFQFTLTQVPSIPLHSCCSQFLTSKFTIIATLVSNLVYLQLTQKIEASQNNLSSSICFIQNLFECDPFSTVLFVAAVVSV